MAPDHSPKRDMWEYVEPDDLLAYYEKLLWNSLSHLPRGLRASQPLATPISLRELRNSDTRRSAHGRNSEAKYTPPHPDGVNFAYEICSSSETDIADTESGYPEGVEPS